MLGLGFPKIRFFSGPTSKVYSIWGSIFGCPYVGRLPLTRLASECREKDAEVLAQLACGR